MVFLRNENKKKEYYEEEKNTEKIDLIYSKFCHIQFYSTEKFAFNFIRF